VIPEIAVSDLTETLRSVTRKAFSDMTPEEINGGYCYRWAAVVKTLIPAVEVFYLPYEGGHVFVKTNGKFYDAESLAGVSNWRKLKSFRHSKAVPTYSDDRLDEVSLEFLLKRWKITKGDMNRYLRSVSK
jgi:hypothetical protein